MGAWYTTRETVKDALDSPMTARSNRQVDRKIEAASRTIDGFLHRTFFPVIETRYFDFPSRQTNGSTLYLNENELSSVSLVTSGGMPIVAGTNGYLLYPDGGPYDELQLSSSGAASFGNSDSRQNDIAITGLWLGCDYVEDPGGELSTGVDAVTTEVLVTDSAAAGVGSILRIGTERLIVTEKYMLDLEQTILASVDFEDNQNVLLVADGSQFALGEVIMVGTEKMLIEEIAGNQLVVKRAWDGSILAFHNTEQPTGSIYAPRKLVVQRGALGTVAASHLISDDIHVFQWPGPVQTLCTAEAINNLMQDQAGWGRTVGSGDNERQMSQGALNKLRDQVYVSHGRKGRVGAI